MTVHPQTGKKEYIFVDLAAIYPTPEEPGSELGFEEIMAANRGWLDQGWDDETVDENLVPEPVHGTFDAQRISLGLGSKIVIHQDPILVDENGHRQEASRGPRVSKKKKVMELNETQISKQTIAHSYFFSKVTNPFDS